MLDDVFYEAYSHALRGPRGGFFFSLPMQIKHLLGAPELDKLLHHLGSVMGVAGSGLGVETSAHAYYP